LQYARARAARYVWVAMKHLKGAAGSLLSIAVLILGACDQGTTEAPAEPTPPAPMGCRQYTTCSACTPVSGCGWCYLANGTGRCAGDPDECARSTEFAWTWDPSGCYVGADADVVATDAAAAYEDVGVVEAQPSDGEATPDAAAQDEGSDAGDEASVSEEAAAQ
jgi:hypothetical protein